MFFTGMFILYRRYGVVDGKFCFEGGSLCGRGEGLYVFLTDQGDEITRSVQVASEGRLNSLRRPLLRNMSGTEIISVSFRRLRGNSLVFSNGNVLQTSGQMNGKTF